MPWVLQCVELLAIFPYLVKELMLQHFRCLDALRVIQLEHLRQQVVRHGVLDVRAQLGPLDLLLLHLIRYHGAVAVLECDLFDGVRAEEARERYQIRNREVLDLRAVVQREDGVAAGAE